MEPKELSPDTLANWLVNDETRPLLEHILFLAVQERDAAMTAELLRKSNIGYRKRLELAEAEFSLNLRQTVVVASLTGAAIDLASTPGGNELRGRVLVGAAVRLADMAVAELTKKETGQ